MKNIKRAFVGLLLLSQVVVAGTGKLTKEDAAKKANLAILRFKNQFESDNPERISSFVAGEVRTKHTDVAGIVSERVVRYSADFQNPVIEPKVALIPSRTPEISILFAQSFGIAQDNRSQAVRSDDSFHQIISTLNQQDNNK